MPTIRPDTCRLRTGSNKGPLVYPLSEYIKRALKSIDLGYYPYLPLVYHYFCLETLPEKVEAEPLVSPEIRGLCLKPTENFKNSGDRCYNLDKNEMKCSGNSITCYTSESRGKNESYLGIGRNKCHL